MNKVYIVSYDLNVPGQDYKGLYDELKKSTNWWHYLDSTWLIYTSHSAEKLFDRLSPHLDKSDRILVIRVTNEYQGWLTEEAWQWIRQYVSQ
jgi:hypothetical protein